GLFRCRRRGQPVGRIAGHERQGSRKDAPAFRGPARAGGHGRSVVGALMARGLRRPPSRCALSRSADVVVVGAGILGASAAWHLASQGLGVVVVDREREPGLGSTSRSTAIIRQRYSHKAAMALALEGLRTWERWDSLVPAGGSAGRAHLVRSGVLF